MLPWLSVLIWLPVVSGIAVLLMGANANRARIMALLLSLVCLACCIPLVTQFDTQVAGYQFIELHPWFAHFDIYYALGIDGFAMPLILLTCFFTPFIILSSWESIQKNVAQYMASFLIMQGTMVGVFCAMDAVLFYLFWEAMLIPMFLIIGIWGGKNRVYATIKFFLYTFFGSVFLLIALVYLHYTAAAAGVDHTFMITTFQTLPLEPAIQIPLFFAMLVAFAVKVPMWPVHTWLPDAHVQAPTGGSVVLAAVLLKLGAYGFLRFILPVVPDAARQFDWLIIGASLIGVVYIGFVALAQQDMKKLIAYSSIAHMGFVTLGLFISFSLVLHPETADAAAMGIEGAYIQMISHGFISGALFLCVGVLYDRMHTRNIADYGGVVNTMPVFAAFVVFFAFANAGLPGTSGFVGEFLVILSAFQANGWYAFFAATTLILGAAYTLWMVKRVILGDVANAEVAALSDINKREFACLAGLAIAALVLGLWPAPLLEITHEATQTLMQQLASNA